MSHLSLSALAACKKQEQWPAALQLLLEFGHFALQLDPWDL